MFKYLTLYKTEYIFIILTATIFLLIASSKSISEENVFVVDNVEVEGKINLNFTRDKYIENAFADSFEMLISKILLSKDFQKIKNIKIDKIKSLIESFQILKESYRNDEYKATFKIFYDNNRVKQLLIDRNISFTQPKNISVVFFPVLFVNDNIKDFNKNFFYNNWEKIKIKNDLINFILPIEDLDDISKIKNMNDKIGEIEVGYFVRKYNMENYVFTLMNYQNDQLKVYLKTNFNNSRIDKNISYNITDINNKKSLEVILKDLKIKIIDLWKEENVINLAMPLSISIQFQHANLKRLGKLEKILHEISIIDNFSLEEFNINNSFYKIYYYGNPKKLSKELSKFGFDLKNDDGYWRLYSDG